MATQVQCKSNQMDREINFEKLDGASNYHVWREAKKIHNAMILKGYDDAITFDATGLIIEKETKKLKKVTAYLTMSINKSLYSSVEQLMSAHGIWTKLKENYDKKVLTRQVNFYRALNFIKSDDYESTEVYVWEVRDEISLLTSFGFTTTDEWPAIALLSGLSKKYDTLLLGIPASGLKLTADVIAAKLIDCSTNGHTASGEKKVAFHAYNRNSNNSSFKGKNKKSKNKKRSSHARTAEEVKYQDSAWSASCAQHTSEKEAEEADIFKVYEVKANKQKSKNSFISSSSKNVNADPKTKTCNDQNSMKRWSVSFSRLDTQNNRIADDENCFTTANNYVTNASANVATEISTDTVLKSVLVSTNIEWTIDSGASAHMTQHDNLSQVTEDAPNRYISTANGEIFKVRKEGSMAVIINNQIITMNNVLFIPELQANLLSVSRIAGAGKKVTFEGNKCVITNPDGKTLAETTAENGIYKLHSEWDTCNLARGDQTQAILWHRRLGHMNPQTMLKMSKHFDLNLNSNDVEIIKFCTICAKGKQTRLPFHSSETKTTEVLALIHSDVNGPMRTASLGVSKYIVIFIDDYSRKNFVYPMAKKDEVFEKFKIFKAFVETQTSKRIRVLRSDNGEEYFSKFFTEFLESAGIHHQTSNAHTLQQNRVAERANRALIEKSKCLMSEAGLPDFFWGEAVNTAAFIINRSINSSTGGIPEELFRGEKIKIDNLRTFGCRVMVLNDTKKHKQLKYEDRSHKMTFIGYDSNEKGYRCYDHEAKKIVTSRDVKFHEMMKVF